MSQNMNLITRENVDYCDLKSGRAKIFVLIHRSRCLLTKKARLLLAIFLLSFPHSSFAILCPITCSAVLNIMPVNFGNVNPYNNTNIVVPAKLNITCSGNIPILCNLLVTTNYKYTLTGGGQGINARTMQGQGSAAGEVVNYNACTSSSCAQAYDNSYSISRGNFTFIGLHGNTDTYDLFFVVPVQPLSVVGTYTDNISTTLTYSGG